MQRTFVIPCFLEVSEGTSTSRDLHFDPFPARHVIGVRVAYFAYEIRCLASGVTFSETWGLAKGNGRWQGEAYFSAAYS